MVIFTIEMLKVISTEQLTELGKACFDIIAERKKVRGITYIKDNDKWRASITRKGKRYQLGYFNTWEDAHDAVINKRAELRRK